MNGYKSFSTKCLAIRNKKKRKEKCSKYIDHMMIIKEKMMKMNNNHLSFVWI